MKESKGLVKIADGAATVEGLLVVPENAKGVILFAHGSGSSRFSPRNNFVADLLQQQGLATLLMDLLTAEEDAVYANRFDISRLTRRLVAVTQWVKSQPLLQELPLGYFGASTGAAVALQAAAALGETVAAIVSRGGRPDLAGNALLRVQAPVLLLVGGEDMTVIALNRAALSQLPCLKKLVLVPGAGHLFEEPGMLEEVARQACAWFQEHLAASRSLSPS
ncbi:dienelactone hydrolase family protein [uncultured Anaeromusa sp.]|uniref:dienelactone hydrolase family protein n=1 Tax=uncultured Anaeromusa sp. TaxID=673273 RepID=UPI0029C71B2A|nr:dienelactone hydrolase family protein [uncultured Anaeromusa sp.]